MQREELRSDCSQEIEHDGVESIFTGFDSYKEAPFSHELSIERFADGLQDIDRFPLLSPEAETELAQRARAGDEDAYNELVYCNLRLVISIARRCLSFAGPSLALSDLVQEGVVGLMHAARKFDHRLGFRFSTYATCWIRQAIMRSIHDSRRIIRLPIHIVEKIMDVEEARQILMCSLERAPNADEVANHIGMTVEKVQLLGEQSQEVYSLENILHKEPDGISLEDFLEDFNAPAPSDCAIENVDRDQVCTIVRQAINQLPKRQARVIRLRYGLDGKKGMTLKAIAKRMSLTPERVRQLERAACEQLRCTESLRQIFVE